MTLRCANPKKQGDIGLGVAIGHFASAGYTVSIPLTDSQCYDLVVDIDGALRRVQVKTATMKRGANHYAVELRTKGGNRSGQSVRLFDPTRVDLLFVLDGEGVKYLLPASAITVRNQLNLG